MWQLQLSSDQTILEYHPKISLERVLCLYQISNRLEMMIIGYLQRNSYRVYYKQIKIINYDDDRLDRYWTVISYIKFVCIFKYGQYFSSFERLGEDHLSRDLLIKLHSIGAGILMLDFKTVVGMLSQPTLLLCLRLTIILVISGIDDGRKSSASGI